MEKEIQKIIKDKGLDDIKDKAEYPLLDDVDLKRVEIIVLKYKSPEMEQDCVSRIIKFTQWPYKLNVFDNRGNGPNTAKVWNKLIRESTCDYVLFIDSDAFVQDTIGVINGVRQNNGVCWLTEMMRSFDKFKNVAIVGPVCGGKGVTTIQSMAPKDSDPGPIDGHLSGYCFLTKRSIYDDVGYFDEDFCFYGQESDWIERVLELNKYDDAGYQILISPRSHVVHGDDKGGSKAAQQAEKESEMSPGRDSHYSYFMWNEKKKIRLAKRGIEYNYHNYRI